MSGRLQVWVGNNEGHSSWFDWVKWPSYPGTATVAQVLGEMMARKHGMVEYPLMQGDGKIICTSEYQEVKVDTPISQFKDMCIVYNTEYYVHFEAL